MLQLESVGFLYYGKVEASSDQPSSQQEWGRQVGGETPLSQDQTPEVLPSLNSVQGLAAGSRMTLKTLRTRGPTLSIGII